MRRRQWFDPALADVMLNLGRDDTFWAGLAGVKVPSDVVPLDPSPAPLRINGVEAALPLARIFAGIVDAKSPWTLRHSDRTARYSQMLAVKMGLGDHTGQRAQLAGFYHDLGKLGVSNLILDKPGRLTDQEFAQVKKHPELTDQLLSPLSMLADITEGAAAHHERLDGSGYHLGRSGDQIPQLGQIVAIADVYDALTQERPYKPALTPDDALTEMERDAGPRLAPDVMAALRESLGDTMFSAHPPPEHL